MPDPQALIRYGLQDDATILVFVLKLSLRCNRAILPRLVHVVQPSKHPRKPSRLVDVHLALKILPYRLFQVGGFNASPNGYNKPLQTLRCCSLIQSTILITRIPYASMRIVAIYFCNVDNPNLPKASFFG